MKIFRDITPISNDLLLTRVQKNSFALFLMGFVAGMSLVLAGVYSKNNDFENVLIMVTITIFFLLIALLLYAFIRSKLIPELEKRLNIK